MADPMLDLLSEVARNSAYPVSQFVEMMDMMRRRGLFIVREAEAVLGGHVYAVKACAHAGCEDGQHAALRGVTA